MRLLRKDLFSENWAAYIIGAALTVCAILFFHSLDVLGVDLTGRTAVLFATVVGAAYLGGLRGGLTSAGIMVLYSSYYFSEPGTLFIYAGNNISHIIAVCLTAPFIGFVVGSLRHQVDICKRPAKAEIVPESSAPDQPLAK